MFAQKARRAQVLEEKAEFSLVARVTVEKSADPTSSRSSSRFPSHSSLRATVRAGGREKMGKGIQERKLAQSSGYILEAIYLVTIKKRKKR